MKQRRKYKWQTRHLHVKIAEQNSLLLKANRLSTKKRVSKMNHRDALPAELQKNSSQEATTTEVTETDTNRNVYFSKKWILKSTFSFFKLN